MAQLLKELSHDSDSVQMRSRMRWVQDRSIKLTSIIKYRGQTAPLVIQYEDTNFRLSQ